MSQIGVKTQENSDIAPMNLMLHLEPNPSAKPISYEDKVILIGSCFSNNIGSKLGEAKFQVLHNPTGIVFDPISVARHLIDYAGCQQYQTGHLFQYNELWHSWFHHSDFSGSDQQPTIDQLNEAIQHAHATLLNASYLFVTLGTAYSYQLKEKNIAVANCHKVPQSRFEKRLLPVSEITSAIRAAIAAVRKQNPSLEIVFTVSPVKHLRDGIIENTRSKALLVEAAHQLAETETGCSYFPAYELVTDVLRDYRFYTTDMAHPSEQAVQLVFEHFCETYLSKETRNQMFNVLQIVSAQKHRPLHPNTQAHQQFLKTFLEKTAEMKAVLPMLNWEAETHYFASSL